MVDTATEATAPDGADRIEQVLVPPLGDMSEPQTRGTACVWCAVALASGRSVDLGEREAAGRHWFPRGCHPCTADKVYLQLVEHSVMCEQCADEAALCPDTRDVRRVLRQARR